MGSCLVSDVVFRERPRGTCATQQATASSPKLVLTPGLGHVDSGRISDRQRVDQSRIRNTVQMIVPAQNRMLRTSVVRVRSNGLASS
jgi:hypothetical protein